MAGQKLFHRQRKDVGGYDVARANRERLAGFPDALSDTRHRAVEVLQAAARRGKQLRTLGCQRNMARGAIEQSESELILELADQQAEPGWSDKERFRSPREVLMLRQHKKSA